MAKGKRLDRIRKLQEAIALAWKWFRRLTEKGEKDPTEFVSALATFAARAAKCGRRVAGSESARDAMSARAQRLHGFVVGTLPSVSTLSSNPLSEALADNTRSEVPDQVHFRLDFPAFLGIQSERNQRIILDMIMRMTTTELARKFKLSQGRISQMRSQCEDEWELFTL